ncbi:DUF4124 domain-containing protein [Aliikangiella sp. IMCC44359]|uniref:DUF4124 domain-containing protein n=1 Tax=Aliikangiella sp. IMCC44359 TaxID=3459125 RepID=UPI00403A930A
MKLSMLLSLFMLSAIAGYSTAESAEQYIYKWKDSQGMVHYTERRPDPGIAFEKVKKRSGKGNSANTSASTSNNEETAEKKPSEEQEKYQSWRKENCRIATQNLDVLKNAARISQDDGQGGKRFMTDEEKQSKIKQMTEQRDKYCKESEEEKK